MVRHLLLSGIFVGLGFTMVAVVCKKYNPRPKTIKRFGIAAVTTIGLVAALSLGATTRTGRCPDDPSEWCHYNDSVPAMTFLVVIFLITCAVRARMIYFER
jgi:hypothetical protein